MGAYSTSEAKNSTKDSKYDLKDSAESSKDSLKDSLKDLLRNIAEARGLHHGCRTAGMLKRVGEARTFAYRASGRSENTRKQ